jgi:hypothetical protein
MSLLLPVLHLNVTIAISFYPVILPVLPVYGITEIIMKSHDFQDPPFTMFIHTRPKIDDALNMLFMKFFEPRITAPP